MARAHPSRAHRGGDVVVRRGTIRLLAAAAVIAAALALAPTGAGAAAPGKAMIRIAHFSPDAAYVDVYVVSLNRNQLFPNVFYKNVSAYWQVNAGPFSYEVRAAGASPSSKPAIRLTGRLQAGHAYTVAAVGPKTNLRAVLLSDDMEATEAGRARVRFIDAAVDLPKVDVAVDGRVLSPKLSFAAPSTYRALPVGKLRVEARRSGGGLPSPVPPAVGGCRPGAIRPGRVAPPERRAYAPTSCSWPRDCSPSAGSSRRAATPSARRAFLPRAPTGAEAPPGHATPPPRPPGARRRAGPCPGRAARRLRRPSRRRRGRHWTGARAGGYGGPCRAALGRLRHGHAVGQAGSGAEARRLRGRFPAVGGARPRTAHAAAAALDPRDRGRDAARPARPCRRRRHGGPRRFRPCRLVLRRHDAWPAGAGRDRRARRLQDWPGRLLPAARTEAGRPGRGRAGRRRPPALRGRGAGPVPQGQPPDRGRVRPRARAGPAPGHLRRQLRPLARQLPRQPGGLRPPCRRRPVGRPLDVRGAGRDGTRAPGDLQAAW